MIYDKIIVALSSREVTFYREEDHYENGVYVDTNWRLYHTIKQGGFIYFIKGNLQLQITTETHIYFYNVDEETLMPKLKNVMYNFVSCTNLLFGADSRYCLTFKQG